MKVKTIVCLGFGLIIYEMIGGAILHALESNCEQNVRTSTLAAYKQFLCK